MTVNQNITGLRDSDRFITNVFKRALPPAIAAIGGVMASTLANSLIAGNLLGGNSLAILSIVNPIYFVFATIGSLAGAGAASVAAWCIGRDDRDGCNAAVTFAAVLSLLVSFVLAVLGFIFLHPLMRLLGANGELFEPAAQYAAVYLFSGIGISGIYPPYFLLKIEGRHRVSMALFVGLAVGCVGLELLCVTVFKMGLNGVAWGCTIANVLTAIIGWYILLGKKSSFRLCPLSYIKGNALRMITAGSPAALNNLCSVMRTVALNLTIVSLAGKTGLSAFSIISMASNISLIFINGLTQTTGPFVGVFTGEHDDVSLKQLEKLALKLGLLLIVPAALALAVFASPFCRLFGVADPETLAVAVSAVRLFAVSLPFAMLSTILMNYYLSAGVTWLANLLTACRSYIMIVLSLLLLSAPLGINGVWLSFTLAELLTWVVIAAALFVFLRKNPHLSGVLLLDRKFSSNGRYISFSVHTNQNDIMNASQRITAFCEDNELPGDRSMLISLSLEEMLISIKDHCFADDPEQEINVRIAIAPGELNDAPILLRIRCSGEPFNPIQYYEERSSKCADREGPAMPEQSPESGNRISADNLMMDFDADVDADSVDLDAVDELLEGFSDLEDSLGIAMILSSAPVVSYNTTFGVNNLTIIL